MLPAAITWPDCHKYFFREIENSETGGLETRRYMCRNPGSKLGFGHSGPTKTGLPCSKTASLLKWRKEECPVWWDPYEPKKASSTEIQRELHELNTRGTSDE